MRYLGRQAPGFRRNGKGPEIERTISEEAIVGDLEEVEAPGIESTKLRAERCLRHTESLKGQLKGKC